MKTKILFFIALLGFSTATTVASPVDTTTTRGVKPFVIVLDAGHGGHDPGKKVGSVNEKDIALTIVKLIGAKLEANPDFKVIYTRKTDVFIELNERANIANRAKADFFVSVHCNAAGATSAAGNETWILGGNGTSKNLEVVRAENSVILLEENYAEKYKGFDPNDPSSFASTVLLAEDYLDQSIELAAQVQRDFEYNLKRKNRGVKQANFAVLRMSYMPSVLIETGFITNSEERDFLNSSDGQVRVANAIHASILQYHSKRDLNLFEVQSIDINQDEEPPAIKISEPKKELSTQVTRATAAGKTLYRVQLAASSKRLDPRPSNFRNMPDITRVQIGSIYKYYSGALKTESEARELLKKAQTAGYPGAFIIVDDNGVLKNL